MVRLLVRGDHENDSFHYMCGADALVQMITRDVASIYALRLTCLKISDQVQGFNSRDEKGIADKTRTVNLGGSSPSGSGTKMVCEILDCCSEANAGMAIREASDALYKMLDRISTSTNESDRNQPEPNSCGVSRQERLREFEIQDPRLWVCGKPLCAGEGRELLRDFVTVNDKTKLTVYLRPAKAGPPPRTNPIDQATYKNMVAYYHKREEDLKQLRNSDDVSRDRDHYLNAEWANPRQLKNSLIGNGGRIDYSF